MFNNLKWILSGMAVACCLTGRGGVLFDQSRNTILVTDYPEASPCNPARLAIFDRAFGWGKITCDPAGNTYTCNCHIAIGDNHGSETYFQVGSPEHPDETLVMHGNIYVRPYWIEKENEGLRWWHAPARVNRLTIGRAHDASVQATLKFAPENSLIVGQAPDEHACRGGQIFIYNSCVTALEPAKGFGIKGARGYASLSQVGGDGHVLRNARISHAQGYVCGGMSPGWKKTFQVENTVFSDFGFMAPENAAFSNCTFEGAKIAALRDRGSMNAELSNCIFRNNERNWELTYADKGLILVDCAWDDPRRADRYRAWTNPNGKKQYPKLSVRRHLVVEVADAAGKPVKDAAVAFMPEQDGCDLVLRPVFKTDARGQTPGPDHPDAMLLTDYIKTATETEDQPALQPFTYSITAEISGKKATAAGVCANESWKIVRIKFTE